LSLNSWSRGGTGTHREFVFKGREAGEKFQRGRSPKLCSEVDTRLDSDFYSTKYITHCALPASYPSCPPLIIKENKTEKKVGVVR
jgi:hypothetical protein